MKKWFKWLVILYAILALAVLFPMTNYAQGLCPTGTHPVYHADGSITCELGGENEGTDSVAPPAEDGTPQHPGPVNSTPASCSPNGSTHRKVYLYQRLGQGPLGGWPDLGLGPFPKLPAGQGYCQYRDGVFDSCENFIEDHLYFFSGSISVCPDSSTAPASPPPSDPGPCKDLYYDGGSLHCKWNFRWHLEAGVSMPPIVLDVRPYPVTFVKWPTAFRVNSLATNSGDGHLDYAGWGGGKPTVWKVGDWRNITLTLTFRPSGAPVTISMPKQPSFTVPSSGGEKTFAWAVASHPSTGADRTAGAVGQLQELAADVPVWHGNSMTTYRLFYTLTYEKYTDHGAYCGDKATPTPVWKWLPTPNKPYQCRNWVPIRKWDSKSESGEILPGNVENLPASLNGGDVFNDWAVVVRRMDENGNVNNPTYAHRYSWGSIFYLACREGQGQIGWPVP